VIYIVTEGCYSDYRICGVFDDKDKAEKFRKHHSHDEVEEHELNPETPQFDGFAYRVCYSFDPRCRNPIRFYRMSNEYERNGNWRMEVHYNTKKPSHIQCEIVADDDEHAAKIASEKVAAFLAGCTHAYHYTFHREAIMEDGVPTPAHKRVDIRETYAMVDGEPRVIYIERF